LYGYSYKNPLNFLRVIGQKDLFCLEENELDIKDLINEPLPSPPKDVVLQSHWLAIHGKQPLLAPNLETFEKDDEEDKKVGDKRKLAKREPKKGMLHCSTLLTCRHERRSAAWCETRALTRIGTILLQSH
jgi:hypothetical protein